MAYLHVKLDTSYHEDEKIIAAGEQAELFYIRALCLAKRTLSDGFISDHQLRGFQLRNVQRRAAKCAEVGLLVRDDKRGGYWIRAWLKHNKSAAEVQELSEVRRRAGQMGGRPKQDAFPEESKLLSRNEARSNDAEKQVAQPETETEAFTETERTSLSAKPADRRGKPKKTPNKPKKPRPRNLIWDALVEVCGIKGELTASASSNLGRCVKELKGVQATPKQIHARAKEYRRRYREADLTPNALVKHWPHLASPNGVQPSPQYRNVDDRMKADPALAERVRELEQASARGRKEKT